LIELAESAPGHHYFQQLSRSIYVALAAEGTKVTIESLIQEVEEALRPPVVQRQLSAANTTLAYKAKLSGLWVDRSEVSGPV
jgi:hypothetical protein